MNWLKIVETLTELLKQAPSLASSVETLWNDLHHLIPAPAEHHAAMVDAVEAAKAA